MPIYSLVLADPSQVVVSDLFCLGRVILSFCIYFLSHAIIANKESPTMPTMRTRFKIKISVCLLPISPMSQLSIYISKPYFCCCIVVLKIDCDRCVGHPKVSNFTIAYVRIGTAHSMYQCIASSRGRHFSIYSVLTFHRCI